MRYQVTDPKGVLLNGKLVPKGEVLPAGPTTSQIRLWIRFDQVKEHDVDAKAKAEADAKAAADADAKAKEEADAKAKADAKGKK